MCTANGNGAGGWAGRPVGGPNAASASTALKNTPPARPIDLLPGSNAPANRPSSVPAGGTGTALDQWAGQTAIRRAAATRVLGMVGTGMSTIRTSNRGVTTSAPLDYATLLGQ